MSRLARIESLQDLAQVRPGTFFHDPAEDCHQDYYVKRLDPLGPFKKIVGCCRENRQSRARPEKIEGIFLVFRVPQIAEMPAVWIEGHSITQGIFERADGFPLGQEIICIVQNMDFGVVAQLISNTCQGAALDEGVQIGLRVANLFLPPGHADRLVVIREREILGFLQLFSHVALRRRQELLVFNDLGYIDKLRKFAVQILGDQVLQLFPLEAGEFLGQPIEYRGIVAPFIGESIDDGKRLRDDFLRFLPAEFSFQRAPFIDLLDGVGEVDRRVD